MTERRRPMRRLGDLLPEAASALGLEEPLRTGRAMAAWQRLVEERVPAAAASSRLLELRGAELVVAAASPIVAQELRLRGPELLAAFAELPGGRRMRELRLVIRPVEPPAGPAGRIRRGV